MKNSTLKYKFILLCSAILSGSTLSQSTVLSPDVASCPDVEVTFSCEAPPESNVLTWSITLIRNGTELMNQLPLRTFLMNDQPESATEEHEGLSFQFTLLETTPALRSTMTTSLPLSLNTTIVECLPNVLGTAPIRPQGLTTSQQMSDGDGVNLTISWDPAARNFSYQATVVPTPRSGQSVYVTLSSSLQLMLAYGVNYTVEVVAFNCVGNSSGATLLVNAVNCGPPIGAAGVVVDPYDSTIEGSVITFHCDDGLVPNKTFTATCLGTAQWSPSPSSHICQIPSAVDCGDPTPPTHGSISVYTSTTESSLVMFQCSKGYFPTEVMNTSCTSDGRWLPDPINTACVENKVSSSHQLSYGGALSLTGVICSTVFFVLGNISGIFCSSVILRYKQSRANKHDQHAETQSPLPVYEDINVPQTSTGNKQNIELNKNVAYGPL